jgi:hypothetical protein
MKKILGLFLGLTLSGCTLFSGKQSPENASNATDVSEAGVSTSDAATGNNESGKNITEGLVQTGVDLGKEYCSEGLYLVTSDETSYLIMETVGSDWQPASMNEIVGSKLRITGERMLGKQCSTQACDCDQSILIETLEVMLEE